MRLSTLLRMQYLLERLLPIECTYSFTHDGNYIVIKPGRHAFKEVLRAVKEAGLPFRKIRNRVVVRLE